VLLGAAVLLSACTTVDLSQTSPAPTAKPARAAQPTSGAKASTAPSSQSLPSAQASPSAQAPASPAVRKPGAYYQDDGPAEQIPEGLLDMPDAEPKIEPLAKGPSKPYTIFEQTYVPITDERPFVQRGVGSWYGKKFHGQKTASGEIYDMFKMTAAHPRLPIPSYARVTNLRNGKQVIVRINDRGPFHSQRIIDLSYTAALKLDYIRGGSVELEVERLLPDEIARLQAEKRGKTAAVVDAARIANGPNASTGTVDVIGKLAGNTLGNAAAKNAQPPASSAASGFFLQFGAYAQEQNAHAMRERLLAGWPIDMPPPTVVQSQGMFRLHAGPFENRELASNAARQLKTSSQIQTTVVQR
jgi:rare lipoprotein A